MYNLKYKSASDYEFIIRMIFNKCSHTMRNCVSTKLRMGGFSLENELPWRLIIKLLPFFSLLNKIKLLKSQIETRNYPRKILRSIVCFKTGKNKRYLKMFDKEIINKQDIFSPQTHTRGLKNKVFILF